MTEGRITSCLKKDGCRRPRTVYFVDVEAYPLHYPSWSGAAGIEKYNGMSTEEMLTYQHSVTSEFDYVDPFLAALRATKMRWDISSSLLGFGDYDGFPTYIQNKPDSDVEGHPGGVERHERASFDAPLHHLAVTYAEADDPGPRPTFDSVSGSKMQQPIDRQQLRLLPDPNRPSLPPQFEDEPEFDEDTLPEGHTDFYPNHEWTTLFAEVLATEDSEHLFTIYGLAEVDQGTRYTTIRNPTPGHVVRAIRQLFPGLLDWHLRVHIVHPQPADMADSTHVLAEFTHPGVHLNPTQIPVVEDVRAWTGAEFVIISRRAVYRGSPSTRLALIQEIHFGDLGIGPLCLSVWFRGLHLPAGGIASLHRGDLVTIHLLPETITNLAFPNFVNALAFYDFAISALQAHDLTSLELIFHSVDGMDTSFTAETFHPGIVYDIVAHAEYMQGEQAAVAFIISTDTEPHTWHFAVGGQTDAGPLAVTVFTTTGPDGQQLSTYRACRAPHWCSITDLVANLGYSIESIGSSPLTLTCNLQIWHGEPVEILAPAYFSIDIAFASYSGLLRDGGTEDEAMDQTSLMQSSPSITPSTTSVTVHLRGMHGLTHSLEVPIIKKNQRWK